MSKRIVMAVAAGVVAGATVVGVPAFAYATSDTSGGGSTGSGMTSMMNDPAFFEAAKSFMSKMMSDAQLGQQMSDLMSGMGDMSGHGMGGTQGSTGTGGTGNG